MKNDILQSLLDRDHNKQLVRDALYKVPLYTVGPWALEVLKTEIPQDTCIEIASRLFKLCKDNDIRIFGDLAPNPDFFNAFPDWLLRREVGRLFMEIEWRKMDAAREVQE